MQRPGVDEGFGRLVGVHLLHGQAALHGQHIFPRVAQDDRDIQLAHARVLSAF